MTSNPNINRQEQYNRRDRNDGNTSDDSLLLMANDGEDKTPLLNDIDHEEGIQAAIMSNASLTRSTHCHVPDDKFDYGARNRLILVLIICIVFMVIEIVGGIISNSTAVITDAAHMAIDVASFLISLTAMFLATKRPTKRLSFGYIRAEVLGALLSVLAIWLVTGVLVYMAIERCINQKFEVKPLEMIIVASCGVVFNIVMFFVLHADVCGTSLPHGHSHGHNHSHSHGHDHDHSSDDTLENVDTMINSSPLVANIVTGQRRERAKKTTKNINVRAAIIHVIGDFVQSVGVLCAAILIKFKPEYKLADPICTFIFSVLVLFTTITIMRDIIFVLMEAVPPHVNYSRVVDDLLRIPGVRNAHSLHIWSLSMQRAALSVHVAINPDIDPLTVLYQAQEMLRNTHSIVRTTIQIEHYDEHVISSCEDCRRPDM
ncbi:unnamed protein product [Rotaria socialis]|uniref:Zinc transporter 2 n=4 Tax=Rotaria socialis TaxID=392032 RepID=A0A817UN25_9BILA|nr:unnamed protein product [Rotaria socialis]CAF3335377.1 unnamed protein product [Rotaria socialis]CAF3403678.1 unnamed protein product [Rotaria socialis]CAF4362324.1 unnamed protein product [Rotaria socialis]